MLAESFVAMMALMAACVLDPGHLLRDEQPGRRDRHDRREAAARSSRAGASSITPDMLTQTAKDVGETTILSRAGGAPTLAVGMAHILSRRSAARR